MFIVVDSGSTKADWAIVSDSDPIIFTTKGINPSTQEVLDDLENFPALLQQLKNARHVYFYGAGITSQNHRQKINIWLVGLGCGGVVEVEGDTLAGARACFGHEEGILGILGTGSNASYYDGKCLVGGIPSLGFILSDEGGGVDLGKEIIKAYIYKTMPMKIVEIFEHKFGKVEPENVIKQLYSKDGQSSYLANFSSILTDIEGDWKIKLFDKCFGGYIDSRLLPLKNKHDVPIKIIGSIGYLHREQLNRVAARYDLLINDYVQKPIQALISHHKLNKGK